jgi:hypothetical protein
VVGFLNSGSGDSRAATALASCRRPPRRFVTLGHLRPAHPEASGHCVAEKLQGRAAVQNDGGGREIMQNSNTQQHQ